MRAWKDKCEYLAVTLHDNDFITELRLMAECIISLPIIDLTKINESASSEDMDKIALSIQYLLCGIYNGNLAFGYTNNYIALERFKPDMKIVDFFDIPEDDNRQSVYIPLFGDKEYIVR